VQLELENLKLFDLAAQEYYRDEFMQQATHTTSKNQNLRARKTEAMVRHLVGTGQHRGKCWVRPLQAAGRKSKPGHSVLMARPNCRAQKQAGTEALENQFGLSRNVPAKLLEE
jgi:hypothetical protein